MNPLDIFTLAPPSVITLFTLLMADPRKVRIAQVWLSLACIFAILLTLFFLSTQDWTADDDQPMRDFLFGLLGGSLVALITTWIAPPVMKQIGLLKSGGAEQENNLKAHKAGATGKNKTYVLLVGDQFVGKTQMIRSLCGDFSQVDPEDRTGADGDEEHRIVEGPMFGSSRFVFIDHRGQDFSSISNAFEDPELANVTISAVVFMTDLFGIPERDGRADAEWETALGKYVHEKVDTIDQERVQHHHRQLSPAALDHIFAALNFDPEDHNRLRSLFVFVNKIDKLNEWPRDLSSHEYKRHIAPVLQDLHSRAQRIEDKYNYKVTVNWSAGSALLGWGIVGKDRLLDTLLSSTKDDK